MLSCVWVCVCVCACLLFPHLINSLYGTIINLIDFTSYRIVFCVRHVIIVHSLDESISFSMCSTLIFIEKTKIN